MIGNESPSEIAACVSVAIVLFGVSLVPFFRLISEQHLTPRWLREPASRTWLSLFLAADRARLAAVNTLLALLLRLNARKGA